MAPSVVSKLRCASDRAYLHLQQPRPMQECFGLHGRRNDRDERASAIVPIRRSLGCRSPGIGKDLGEEALIGRSIDHEHDVAEQHPVEQLFDLEHAALIAPERSSWRSISTTSLSFLRPVEHHLPGVVMAKEVGNSKAAVDVAPLSGLAKGAARACRYR